MYFPSVVKENKIKSTDKWIELEKIKDYLVELNQTQTDKNSLLHVGIPENSLVGRDRRRGKVETRCQILLKRKLNVYGGKFK